MVHLGVHILSAEKYVYGLPLARPASLVPNRIPVKQLYFCEDAISILLSF